MKKLKLTLANMQDAEVLTREQLRKVTGGQICSFNWQCGTDGQCIDGFCSPYTGSGSSCYDGNNGGCGIGMICVSDGSGTRCI